jgi:hypothetical protein
MYEADIYAARMADAAIQCPHCFGVRLPSYTTCRSCEARFALRTRQFFSTIVPADSAWYHAFFRYKRPPHSDAERIALAAALSGGYEQHADRIADVLGGAPTMVSIVPSTRPGMTFTLQPLRQVVESVAALRALLRPAVVTTTPHAREKRTFQPDCFSVLPTVHGHRLLLIEDLAVGLSTMHSVLQRCRLDGIAAGVLSIGREVHTEGAYSAQAVLPLLGKPAWW